MTDILDRLVERGRGGLSAAIRPRADVWVLGRPLPPPREAPSSAPRAVVGTRPAPLVEDHKSESRGTITQPMPGVRPPIAERPARSTDPPPPAPAPIAAGRLARTDQVAGRAVAVVAAAPSVPRAIEVARQPPSAVAHTELPDAGGPERVRPTRTRALPAPPAPVTSRSRAAVDGPASRRPASQPPPVEISIDRIDVRVVAPGPSAPPRPSDMFKPRLSLEEYLTARSSS